MKVITNTEIIETRSKWAKRIAPLTMLFLIGGLITNFMSMNRPEFFRPTMILLAFGFVFAIISSYLTNRWVREPRSDQILTNTLKKFSNEFILFNYTTSPAHVLLTPSCLFAIVIKQHDGKITVNGRRFGRGFSWKLFFRFFAEEGLGAPVSEAESGVNKLIKQLNKELASEEIPEIKPLVLFSNKDAQLTVDNPPPVPVLRSNEFKTYLRDQTKNKNISATQRKTLAQIIGGRWAEPQKI
jgi:hypothetical protein